MASTPSVADALAPLSNALTELQKIVQGSLGTMQSTVSSTMGKIQNAVLVGLSPLIKIVGGTFEAVTAAVTSAMSPLAGVVQGALDHVGDVVAAFFGGFAGRLSEMLEPMAAEWGAWLAAMVAETLPGLAAMLAEWTATMLGFDTETAAGAGAALAEWLGFMLGIDTETAAGAGAALAEWLGFMLGIDAETAAGGTVVTAIWSAVMATVGAEVVAVAGVIYAALAPFLPIILAVAAAIAIVVAEMAVLAAALMAVAAVVLVVVAVIVAIVAAVAMLAAAVMGVTPAIIGMGMAISQFVGKANPAAVQLFNNAVDDFTAVIGHALVPVLQVITRIVRMAADTLTIWVGQMGEMAGMIAQGLMPLFEVFFGVLGKIGQAIVTLMAAIMPAIISLEEVAAQLAKALEPVLGVLIDLAVAVLVPALKLVTNAIVTITHALMPFLQLLNYFLQLIGGSHTTAIPEGASVGAAVKSVNIGSVQSVIQSAMKSAYSMGNDPAVKSVNLLSEIKTGIENLPGKLATAILENLPGGKEVMKAEEWITKDGVAGTKTSTGSKNVDWIINHTPPAVAVRGAVSAWDYVFG